MAGKISFIITGGMILEEYDAKSNQYVPKTNSEEILKSISEEISTECLEITEFSMIDSSTVNLEFLQELAKLVQRKVNNPKVSGVIIIHGTDTLEITSYFLYRCIYVENKPIILTGSSRINSSHNFDGNANITNSIKQALNPECSKYAEGVTINFAGKIHSPAYIHKEHSFALDPFSSGRPGIIGMMHLNNIVWYNKASKCAKIPMPKRLESVPMLYAVPGATDSILDPFIDKFNALVVVAYGCGNVSNPMYYAIVKAINHGLKIILVTNCKFGGTSSEYGDIGGNQSLKDLGVIMANDLNAYQAMIVASLAINNENISSEIKLENFFNNNIILN